MKIAHISDTHIFNKKFYEEYKIIFNSLFEELKNLNPDIIVHTGDIAHSKVNLSPEYFDLCYYFLDNLQKLAPTYIILGNHDCLINNKDRLDAITPIIESLENKNNIFLLKKSQEVHLNDKFCLNSLSLIDEENWILNPTKPEKVNIALYHGSISGCKTDKEFVIENGEQQLNLFRNFDYGLLGDIHKTNQIMDKHGKIRYAGSTTQTNFGEFDDKGFLFWDIKDKNDFTVKHVHIPNPRPFTSIILTKEGKIEAHEAVKGNSRLRLVSQSLISPEKQNALMYEAKKRFQPFSISFSTGNFWTQKENDNFENLNLSNLRNEKVQEQLMEDFLVDYKLDTTSKSKLFELNSYYNDLIFSKEQSARNVQYNIDYFEWDNLLCFGENNKVNFQNISEIVGIFGKNFSGKSSFIDSLLFTIFGSISKNCKKIVNIINHDKEKGYGLVHLTSGNKKYIIKRSIEKYNKKLKGEVTVEAKVSVEFDVIDLKTEETKNLTLESVIETNNEIKRHFGTLEDFLLTSLSWQFGAFNFIEEGSTERNKILSRFMDIDFFYKKYEMAKEDSRFLKKELKNLENFDIKLETKELVQFKNKNEKEQLQVKSKIEKIKQDLNVKEQEFFSNDEKIKSIVDVHSINIDSLKNEKEELVENINNIEFNINNNKINISLIEDKLVILNNKITSLISEEKFLKSKKEFENLTKNINSSKNEISQREKSNQEKLNRLSILNDIPCGEKYYDSCKFIKDAAKLKKDVDSFSNKELEKQLEDYKTSLNELNFNDVEEKYNIKQKLLNEKQKLSSDKEKLSKNNLEKALEVVENKNKLNLLENEINFYNINKEKVENINKLKNINKTLSEEKNKLKKELQELENSLYELYKNHGSTTEKINNLNLKEQDLKEKRNKFEVYELFISCYHPRGIVSRIIQNNLNTLNTEISKIIKSVSSLNVHFVFNNSKLFINLEKNNQFYPIEMGSGAEKTLAAFAIRLALTKLTTLPKSNIFILDEPATSLDDDNLEQFLTILEILKNYFSIVFVISHLGILKESVDSFIDISRLNNYPHLNL